MLIHVILRMLLQYEGGGIYPIYASFLDMLSYHCQTMPQITISTPLFSNEEGRIGCIGKRMEFQLSFMLFNRKQSM